MSRIKLTNVFRNWEELQQLQQRRINTQVLLVLSDLIINVKVVAFLPIKRECAFEYCNREFAPTKANQIYCCEKHNFAQRYLRRRRALGLPAYVRNTKRSARNQKYKLELYPE